MSVIQFDVDGVLADFTGGYVRTYEKLHGAFDHAKYTKWDDFWDKSVWEEIKASATWWLGLGSLIGHSNWVRINALQDQHDVYFVTNRNGLYPKFQTTAWLRFMGVQDPTVVISKSKGEFAKAVGVTHAIDDKAGNAVFMQYHSPLTRSYLVDTRFNRFDQSVLGTKVIRITWMAQFLDDVEAA